MPDGRLDFGRMSTAELHAFLRERRAQRASRSVRPPAESGATTMEPDSARAA